jgi:CBS domain-containing protein
MATVNDILALKDRNMITISPEATLFAAAVLMTDRKVGSLLVMDDGQLVGILAERDFLINVVTEQRDAQTTHVGEVMERDVFCCRPHTDLEEAKSVMKNRRVRHLPVMDDEGSVVGLISIGDLNAYQTDYHERTIYLLQEYIHTTR